MKKNKAIALTFCPFLPDLSLIYKEENIAK
jgi:hypothetical protein